MKFLTSASSIIFFSCFFLLVGCDSFHAPGIFEHDEVPSEIKAAPRLVETPPPSLDEKGWPRLGDVPARPRNLTPKTDFVRTMEELDYERAEAEAAKKEALQNDPTPGDAALQNTLPPEAMQPPQFSTK